MTQTETLARTTGISPRHVQNILRLLEEGATVPFIARYRKEQTGGATDEQLRVFQETHDYSRKLSDRKEEALRLIAERGHLDEQLKRRIEGAETLTAVEDLYRPYRLKRNTRAGVAIEKGLEPLADLLQSCRLSRNELMERAAAFVRDGVGSAEEAINGAKDILAERYSDDAHEREVVRRLVWKNGILRARKTKELDPGGVYARYADHSEPVASVPSHRYLAIMRAVREKQLRVAVDLDTGPIVRGIHQEWVRPGAGSSAALLMEALEDGLKRLLLPSIEREVHRELKERSDRQAIGTFGRNLAQLLMTPPVAGAILGVDPAYRTGCKLAAVDEYGRFLEHAVIYPTPPVEDYEGAKKTVLKLVRQHGITGIAIGNGTGCRETQEFFARLNAEAAAGGGDPVRFTVVSEAGASVYSASEIARAEYPALDVTVRGAISIAHRLQNPVAALVKIDPRALGIGQYQHDVDQGLLARKLDEITEDLVNRVGVDVNTASGSLLAHVAGVGDALAARIVKHREEHGPFRRKIDLKKVRGVGEAAFEQCSGFLRVRDGESVLDNTGVHPESYGIAQAILEKYDVSALGPGDTPDVMREIVARGAGIVARGAGIVARGAGIVAGPGEETVRDIIRELRKPGFDPRSELPPIPFREGITDISMLGPGSVVSGVVRSIVDFGAFVDIGLKNDGLIHISQMSDQRVGHPVEVLSVNQYLPFITVLKVDVERQKIDLSLRDQPDAKQSGH